MIVTFARYARGTIWAAIVLIAVVGSLAMAGALFAPAKSGADWPVVERLAFALGALGGSLLLCFILDKSLTMADIYEGRAIWIEDEEVFFAGKRAGQLDQVDFEKTGRGGLANAQFVLECKNGKKFQIPLFHIGCFTGGADKIVREMQTLTNEARTAAGQSH